MLERATGARDIDAVRHYFATRYPDRGARALMFRRGENERAAVVRRWLAGRPPADLLDAGCGDGVFLSRVLGGRLARLRVEDLVPKMVAAARARLAGHADRVDAVVTDVCASEDPSRYDVVLALGLLDYERDWRALTLALLRRARGALIIDLPRAGTFHHALRRVWLAAHGIDLRTASRADVDSLAASAPVSVEVVELPLQWMVRLTPCAPAREERRP